MIQKNGYTFATVYSIQFKCVTVFLNQTISSLVTDYIQKRRGQALLFSFEYNLLPNLISNFNQYMDRALVFTFQDLNDKIYNYTIPFGTWQLGKIGFLVNFTIQKLKSKHLVCLSF